MSDKVFVDTNVLVYVRDSAEPEKQLQAEAWLGHLWTTGAGCVSVQVLSEYFSVVTTKLKQPLPHDLAWEDVEDLLIWQPASITSDTLIEARKLQSAYGLSWWDALIISTAKQTRCDYLLSEDFQHGQDYDGIRVISPFRAAPGNYN